MAPSVDFLTLCFNYHAVFLWPLYGPFGGKSGKFRKILDNIIIAENAEIVKLYKLLEKLRKVGKKCRKLTTNHEVVSSSLTGQANFFIKCISK